MYSDSNILIKGCALQLDQPESNCVNVAGFQPIPALANLEGLLNSLASGSAMADGENGSAALPLAKKQDLVQHKGCLGFLQGFLKLQQAMEEITSAQDQLQVCFSRSLIKP